MLLSEQSSACISVDERASKTPMVRIAFKSALVWLATMATSVSAQDCRQALVLGLDVSLSVDVNDFSLQRHGLAQALIDPDVVQAMIGPYDDHIELAVFEWSGQFNQSLLVDWTRIDGPETLGIIAETLRTEPQVTGTGRTALGAAMLYGRDLLATRSHCTKQTLDISGDGMNNNGVRPQDAKPQMDAAAIVVNALVIGPAMGEVTFDGVDVAQLSRYFHDRVITGPFAFVETIAGFASYEDAIKRKLLREVTQAHVQQRPHPPNQLIRRLAQLREPSSGPDFTLAECTDFTPTAQRPGWRKSVSC